MGVFSFMRKKKSQRALSIPSAPPMEDTMEGTVSFEDAIPPPSGFDEDIPPPRSIDEIEIPESGFESAARLEFPEIPKEEPTLPPIEEQEPKVEFFEDELEVPPPAPTPPTAAKKKQKKIIIQEEEELEIPALAGEQETMPMTSGPAQKQEEPGVIYEKGGPIFVNLKRYGTLLETIEGIKGRLRESATSLNNANAAKSIEDSKLAQWQGTIESIQRKLLYVDKVLFEK